MVRAPFAGVLVSICTLLALADASRMAHAQQVWSGFDFTFVKASDASPTLPENQDRITPNVWLTRDVQQGLFNIAAEVSYSSISPSGTEWATDINNAGKTIAAENWADLAFEPWIEAYNGMGSGNLPNLLTSHKAVVHLITDDIYLDLRFLSWVSNASGGGFSYERALPPPPSGATGDYNLNGVVDAADYTLWRDTLGQNVTPGDGADGDESGTIDSPDYDFWKQHFGELIPLGSAAGASPTAVPEPTAATLLLTGLLALCTLVRRP